MYLDYLVYMCYCLGCKESFSCRDRLFVVPDRTSHSWEVLLFFGGSCVTLTLHKRLLVSTKGLRIPANRTPTANRRPIRFTIYLQILDYRKYLCYVLIRTDVLVETMAAIDRNNPLLPGGAPEVFRPLFLRILRNSGVIREAAESAGLTPYQVRAAMRRDPGFAELVNDALEDATDLLEMEMRRRALAGSDLLMMFALKKLRPEFRDRVLPNNVTQVNVKAYVGFSPDDWDNQKSTHNQIVDSTVSVLGDSTGTTEPDLDIQAPALADSAVT